MSASRPSTVAQWLEQLPPDRRKAIEAIRRTIRRHLPKGYEEGIQYGMIGWYVPHSRYPAGYHCDPRQPVPFAGLGNWKGHIGIHLFCTYVDESHHEWFRKAWVATGKRLDMGKGCVRVKRLEEVPLEVLGEAIARVPVDEFLRNYESIVPASKRKATAKDAPPGRLPAKKTQTKKTQTKKTPAKKTAVKKVAVKKVAVKKTADRRASTSKATPRKAASGTSPSRAKASRRAIGRK